MGASHGTGYRQEQRPTGPERTVLESGNSGWTLTCCELQLGVILHVTFHMITSLLCNHSESY